MVDIFPEVSNMKVIYSGVRAEMARRGVSQQKLAELLDVHYNTIGNWLRGEHDPGMANVIQALMAIGISKRDVLDMRVRDLVTVIEDEEQEAPA